METTAGSTSRSFSISSRERSSPSSRARDESARCCCHQKGAAAVREFCAQATNNEADIQVYLDLEKQLATRPELLKQLSLELAELPDPAQPSSAEGSDSP